MLKQLFQLLLNTRTTLTEASHASKPVSGVPVDYTSSPSIDGWGKVLPDSTASYDGYIWVAGRTTSDKGFIQISTQAMQTTTTGTSNPGGETLNIFAPVSKGQAFTVYGRALEQIAVRLVKTIGGGYNIFVWRALSCLRALSNYLPKVFSRAKGRGLAPKLSLRQNWFLSPLPMEALISLLTTAGFASGVRQLHEQSCTQPWLPPLMCKKERYAMRPLERAKLLLSSSALKPHKPRPSLFFLLDQVNSFKGGAAC